MDGSELVGDTVSNVRTGGSTRISGDNYTTLELTSHNRSLNIAKKKHGSSRSDIL